MRGRIQQQQLKILFIWSFGFTERDLKGFIYNIMADYLVGFKNVQFDEHNVLPQVSSSGGVEPRLSLTTTCNLVHLQEIFDSIL